MSFGLRRRASNGSSSNPAARDSISRSRNRPWSSTMPPIQRIAEILRTSREVWPSHPRTKWTASVEMVTHDGTYYFSVHATVAGDANGTLVRAQTTKQGDGWNVGDVRADGRDQVLEDAVRGQESTD